MDSSLQVFNNEDFGEIRALEIDGQPWFVAKDVCDALGLGRQQDSTRYLDDDEKGECLVDTTSGQQRMVIVTEAGLYSLILRSRKPEAKAFKRWVTHEVLPAIRRHGLYATPEMAEAARYLTQTGTKMGVQRLYALLRADELVCKRTNAPTRKAIDRGLAVQVMSTRTDGKANDPYARLTQKGLDWCVTHYVRTPAQMRA